ncbi:hypothetical protein CTheo_6230 [Ceratobasidium theobromae]|uniref:Uncharacterized protein n=1 Tax=Ceratobasidium theobromae TaxID=1582974 RepID=A0A5N5QF10_9AGAM|nr:hypothetical protein CTheo_6230 [Ceratobasidium theobromae]
MLGAARAAARSIRRALGANDIYAARAAFDAYKGPSRLPLLSLVHGTIRTHRPMAAAVAIESHLECSKTLPIKTLHAYISALTTTEPQIVPAETVHTPTSAALTILAAARRSRQQKRTTLMYDAAIRACLVQGEILTGSLLFVLLVRDWQNRHREEPVTPPEPLPEPTPNDPPAAPSPLRKWGRSFPTSFTSPIPEGAPEPPFPSPHLLEAIVSALELRPRINPQATQDFPPGRPPDSILALAHLTRLFTDGVLPFSRHAALLNAMTRVPPMLNGTDSYFHSVLRRTCRHPPLLDTRSYNVLLKYSFDIRKPKWAENLVNHMSTVRDPPLRITDVTRTIIARGEAKARDPGLAAHLLAHIDAKGHSTRLYSTDPPAPPPAPVHAIDELPTDPHLLAVHISNLTSLGRPTDVISILASLLPDLNAPHDKFRIRRNVHQVILLGPTILTSLLNALCKAGKTGLAERIHRLGVLVESLAPSFVLPLAFHTMMLQLYAREARKGLVIIVPKPSPLKPPHQARAIVDSAQLLFPSPKEPFTFVRGWGWDTPLPDNRTLQALKRWYLARNAAAHIYLTLIRPALPVTQPTSKPPQTQKPTHYTPDARLFNALLDIFSRRPNMLLRTFLSHITRRRERLAAHHVFSSVGPGIPRRADAFMAVLVRDMADVGMGAHVPGGWRHLLPRPGETHYSAATVLDRAARARMFLSPVPGASRWRAREAWFRSKFGKPPARALLWARSGGSREGPYFREVVQWEKMRWSRRARVETQTEEKDVRRERFTRIQRRREKKREFRERVKALREAEARDREERRIVRQQKVETRKQWNLEKAMRAERRAQMRRSNRASKAGPHSPARNEPRPGQKKRPSKEKESSAAKQSVLVGQKAQDNQHHVRERKRSPPGKA